MAAARLPERAARALIRGASMALAALLVLGALPSAVALETTGAWVFPHEHQATVLSNPTDAAYYIGDNDSAVLANSFFADSQADAASVQVDLYNPTDADLIGAQLFVSVGLGYGFGSLSFSGGEAGDLSYDNLDALTAGTPFGVDSHDVYPAYFASYGVGDLAPGTSGIATVWVNATGDFAGGLVLHIDYAATDASGNTVSGPFDADMNIFEAGESACEAATPTLVQSFSDATPGPGDELGYTLNVSWAGGDLPATYEFKAVDQWTLTHEVGHSLGAVHNTTGDWVTAAPSGFGENHTAAINLSRLVIVGDSLAVSATVRWTDPCGGRSMSASAQDELPVVSPASGEAGGAGYWREQMDRAAKGKGDLDFGAQDLARFLDVVAMHSLAFNNGGWDGVDPLGGSDEGWLDVGSFEAAVKVLEGASGDSGPVRQLERQELALWLNVASGALNLGTALEINAPQDSNHQSDFEKHTGLSTLSADYDSVVEVLALAAAQASDWADGHGGSRAALDLVHLLCKAANEGWVVPA